MIKISLKGLAKYMTASPVGQRKVLRDFKYPDPAAARLRHNARAIAQYAEHFAGRDWEVQPGQKLALFHGDVKVTVVPDLVVIERGHQLLVRLEFSQDEPNQQIIRILGQGMFEAAQQAALGVRSSHVLILDVPRGGSHRARTGSRIAREIEAACRNISAVWPGI